jgi:glycerol kinase
MNDVTCKWLSMIVWQDIRTQDILKDLIEKTSSKNANHFQRKTGLPLSTYFSALKLKWLLDNVPEVKKASHEKRLLFGTVDSWMLYVSPQV